MAAVKRLMKDLKQLQDTPLPGAAAEPLESDMFTWHGNILVPLTISDTLVEAPLHLVMTFPRDYPASPPNAGFCTQFPYRMGANYVESSGPLAGKMVVCLDILGNFQHYHTEWKGQVGSGWAPGMSVSSVLVQLQSLLCELDANLHPSEKQSLFEKLSNFSCSADGNTHSFDDPWPALLTLFQIQAAQQEVQPVAVEVPKGLSSRISAFLQRANLTQPLAAELDSLIQEALRSTEDVDHNSTESERLQGEVGEGTCAKVDTSIACYFTGATYKEDVLGYGVSSDGKTLTTAGELISYSAFHEHSVRQTSNKSAFTHWIPAYINAEHADKRWEQLLQQSIQHLGGGALKVLPQLINSMVVQIMKGDKAAAIAFFEALCSFWRTLFHVMQAAPHLRKQAETLLEGFASDKAQRHKDVVPDVGQLLAMFTACNTGVEARERFTDAYLDENFIRCVMWWRDRSAPNSAEVFTATQVSRDIVLFQLAVLHCVIGDDAAAAASAMDSTNGKVEDRLVALQELWKQHDVSSWREFFEASKCSSEVLKHITSDVDAWIKHCIAESDCRGPRYKKQAHKGGGGGGRKGAGRGRR